MLIFVIFDLVLWAFGVVGEVGCEGGFEGEEVGVCD